MYVFETQEAFRFLVQVTSYVGEVAQLPEIENNLSSIHNGVFLLAATLLDQEVSFTGLGFSREEIQFISQEFRSSNKEIEVADYVFCSLTKCTATELQLLTTVKIGHLIDPQNSATIIGLCSKFNEQHPQYEIQGPGIQGKKQIHLPEECAELIVIRNQLNSEYPLGIDLYIVDECSNVLSIPRTTQIKEVR